MKLFARKVVLLPHRACRNVGRRHAPGRSAVPFRASFRRRHSQPANGRRRLSPAQPLRRRPVLRRRRGIPVGKRPRRPVARRPLRRQDQRALLLQLQGGCAASASTSRRSRRSASPLRSTRRRPAPPSAKRSRVSPATSFSPKPTSPRRWSNTIPPIRISSGSPATRSTSAPAMRCGCWAKRRAMAFRRPTTPSPSRRRAFRAADAAARKSELIRFEMALSARVLRYAHDAEGGRINPNRISGYHDFPEKPFDMVGGAEGPVARDATRAAGWRRGIPTTPSTRRCASSSRR